MGEGEEERAEGEDKGEEQEEECQACSQRPVALTALPAPTRKMLTGDPWHLLQTLLLSPKASVTLPFVPHPQWLPSLILLVPCCPQASAEGWPSACPLLCSW